jgi:hypothetical protein
MQPSEYDQGVTAGKIEQQLTEHSQHLAKINGSIDDFVAETKVLVLVVQRLADAADADRAAAVKLAAALKEADDARRKQADAHWWKPMSRVLSAVIAAAAVIAVWISWTALHTHK